MNRDHGFTLVELLVTITIMVILITLSVVNLRSSQATARDDQRTTDIQTIAQNLETYYRSGSETGGAGEYPPTDALASESAIKSTLRDIDAAVLRAPNIPDTDPVSLTIASTNNAQVPTVSTYIYQPLQSDGQLCGSMGDECRKFYLYYMLESEPGVVKKVTSKNQ